ncbi:MAG: hypothetical protein V1746_07975 [bacterium]
MSRLQILIILPSEETSSGAVAVEETLRRFNVPVERIFVEASGRGGRNLPRREDVFCLVVRQHPRAVAWAERHYPDSLMLMISRSFKDCSCALEVLKEAAKKPLGKARPTFTLGKAGETNAALFAVAMMAVHQPDLRARLLCYRKKQTRAVLNQPPLS